VPFIVAGFIASLKVAVKGPVGDTSLSPLLGLIELTVGSVMSAVNELVVDQALVSLLFVFSACTCQE
jgi:hypothetical protein